MTVKTPVPARFALGPNAQLSWPPWTLYLLAAVLSVATLILRMQLAAAFAHQPLLIILVLPVIVSAMLGGLGPGLFATLLVAFGADYLAIPPVDALAIRKAYDLVQWSFLMLSGVLVSVLAEQMRRSWRQSAEAMAALHASEARLRLFIEHAPVALAMFDRELRYLAVSQRWRTDYGFAERDLIGQSPYAIFPEIPERWKPVHWRCLHEDDVVSAKEERFERRDGSVQWLRWEARPWRGADGAIGGIILFTEDITEAKQAERALGEASETRAAILQGMTEGLMIATPAGEVIDINPAAQRLHGFTHKREALRPLAEYPQLFDVRDITGAVQPPEQWPLARACRGEIFTDHELRVRRRDTGQTFIGSYGGTPVRDPEGRSRLGIVTIRDISAQKRAEEQIHQLAFYDPLTGLPNRRLLEERLTAALAQAKRQGECLAVMVLDLDHFKAINDALGHAAGDALLAEVARRMRSCVRASDTVARPGGDEFMLILPRVTAQGAAHLAEKLVTHLAAPLHLDGQELTVSCSLGISISNDEGDSAGKLIARADTAMYQAKQAGRNRYQFFTAAMQREALHVMTLEHQLRQGLKGGELCLHYQPQVELASGRTIGLEALLRWAHPVRGLLGADQFIPLAEKSGLIEDIGTWVLVAVVAQVQAWARAGLPLVPVAVNLSAQQFCHHVRRRALNAQVRELLTASGLAPALLELEITENSLLEESEDTLATLAELRALGVRLTLDDFGTGYSSLSTLKSFPVSRLKIDQSFVRAVPNEPKQAAIVEAILALGRHLDFEVIAEGVETPGQLEQLRRQGCRQGQGYYFSRPLPPEAVEPWLEASGPLTRCATTAVGAPASFT